MGPIMKITLSIIIAAIFVIFLEITALINHKDEKKNYVEKKQN